MYKKLFSIITALVISLPSFACAETLILKSGQKIEGKIIEKTDKYIRIEFEGVILPYFYDQIQSIDGKVPNISISKESCPGQAGIKPNTGNKIQLSLNLKPGAVYNLIFNSEQKISQLIGNKQEDLQQVIATGYDFAVESQDPACNYQVKNTYTFTFFKQSNQGRTVSYDSRHPPKEIHPLTAGYAALSGESFTMVITPKGHVKDVRGINNMIKNMLKKINLPQKNVTDALESELKDRFNDKSMKETMENMFDIYPEKPVGIGDAWDKEIIVTKGMPMNMHNTYILRSRRSGIAFVDVSSRIASLENKVPFSGGGELVYEVSGTQAGTIEIDEATGLILHNKIAQQLSGQVNLINNPNLPTAVSWPIQLNTVSTLETKKPKENQK